MSEVSSTDVQIGVGDGTSVNFQLFKVYSSSFNSYTRIIKKPVGGTVKISLDDVETTNFTVDNTTGVVTMNTAPSSGVIVKAGFEFDVPVRFDIDQIVTSVEQFNAGAVPEVDVVEIRI